MAEDAASMDPSAPKVGDRFMMARWVNEDGTPREVECQVTKIWVQLDGRTQVFFRPVHDMLDGPDWGADLERFPMAVERTLPKAH